MIPFKECLIEALQCTPLFEMAYSKEKYVDEVCDRSEEIVQNLFLIMLSQETGQCENYRSYWLDKLETHVYKLWCRLIQSDKRRALLQAFDREDLDSSDKIRALCKRKLIEELEFDMGLDDVPYELWNRLITFLFRDLVEIICDPRSDPCNELRLRLNID